MDRPVSRAGSVGQLAHLSLREAGYSRLMRADEVGTLKRLTERRTILNRFIGEHRGRIANTGNLLTLGSIADTAGVAASQLSRE